MILIRLQLQNFRQYQRLDLAFRDGITGIVGRNGAGKSTILEAVLWCLFGTSAARTDKEGIKRQGAPVAEPCVVTLEFELKGSSYCLTRSLIGKSNRSEAKLERRGRLDAISTREVDDYIVRLIGLDLRGFLSSFFARQKELNALTDDRPAQRKEHLAQMLGVGRLDNAIQLLKDDIKTARQKIDILSSIQIDPDLVNAEMQEKQSRVDVLDKSMGLMRTEIGLISESIILQDKEIQVLKAREKEATEFENRLIELSTRQQEVEKQIEGLLLEVVDIDGLANELPILKTRLEKGELNAHELSELRKAEILARERNRLENDLSATQAVIDNKTTENGRLEIRMSQLNNDLTGSQDLDNQLAELEIKREALAAEYREIKGDLRIAEADLAKLLKQKQEIAKLGPEAVCEFCLRPFGEEFSEIEGHFDQEIISHENRIDPLRKRLADREDAGRKLKESLDAVRTRSEAAQKLKQEQAAASASLISGQKVMQDTISRKDAISSRLSEIGDVTFDPERGAQLEEELRRHEEAKAAFHRLSEKVSRKPQVEEGLRLARESMVNLDRHIEETSQRRQTLQFDKDAFQRALDQLATDRDKAEKLRLQLERQAGDRRLLESEIAGLSKKLAEYEKAKKEIGALRELLTYLEKVSLLFVDFRLYLIGRIRPSLSRQTSKLFYDMTDGRYQEVALDEDYNLRLYDHGEDFPLDRFSGGEIDLANLCLRLAISIEMASGAGIDYSFIILDEIFGSQDSDRQRLIFEGLARLKNRFRQIIIISHIDDVKEMAEHIISVEVDPSGVSVAQFLEGQ